ncbi:MAG: hypothetical protein K6G13_00125 [Agathobacter sp.]|uniref:hypothetical protein n=1 Tax=Agathobacter sp. TaxID=2021311 RepID=UPI00259041D9|nr:hypothetical protein [Agathobacter sp.]MCR5676425.1 hypothetical protein [Agathobacter sp.]
MGKIQYEIIENIAKITTKYDEIQVNLMKWGSNPAKYDIRKWSFDGEPLKGFTLSEDELLELYRELKWNLDDSEDEDLLDDELPFPIDDEESEEPREEEIDFRKFVIHSDMSSCNRKGHDCEEINARIYVFSSSAGMQEYVIDAYYCEDCKAYYISESVYNALKQKGNLMCQVFTPQSFEEYKKESNYGANFLPEGILHIAGYNVGQADNLSADERRKILEYIMESGLLKKNEILFRLNEFIKSKESIPNMELAVSKWKADRDWLRGYSSAGKRLVGIKYIIAD